MSDTKLMSLEARPEREDYLNPATREEAPAEAGEPEALRMAYKTGYQEGVEDSDGNFCRDACEEGWGKYLETLRAQPQAREGEAVRWFGDKDYDPTEAMIDAGLYHNHRHNPESNMIASFKAMMSQAEIDGLVSYTHPTPDALRIAVEAFNVITDLSVNLRQGGPDSSDLNDLSDALNTAVDVAHEALAALRAEQKGGA